MRIKHCEEYILKRTHPAVRRANACLKKKRKEEKKNLENMRVNKEYDWKNDVQLHQGTMIDRFVPNFFPSPYHPYVIYNIQPMLM